MELNEIKQFVKNQKISDILEQYPYTSNFFDAIRLEVLDKNQNLLQIVKNVPEDHFNDYGLTSAKFIESFITFVENIEKQVKEEEKHLESITIIGGKNKSGDSENIQVTIKAGEIVCIVGPTGSGKSRLLEDIECIAQKDTPTMRQILLEGKIPKEEVRFEVGNKLVAQLSQNMNFVMDLSVKDFLEMHAQSRMIENSKMVVEDIIICANDLAGEKFNGDVKVTQLSGGQSRALMVADIAMLSSSPIILIDEIENAGIDKKKALETLVKREKIILMSTHDPTLALMGHKRIVIKNGGIKKVIETSERERINLPKLIEIDERLNKLRNVIRYGQELDFDINEFIEGGK